MNRHHFSPSAFRRPTSLLVPSMRKCPTLACLMPLQPNPLTAAYIYSIEDGGRKSTSRALRPPPQKQFPSPVITHALLIAYKLMVLIALGLYRFPCNSVFMREAKFD